MNGSTPYSRRMKSTQCGVPCIRSRSFLSRVREGAAHLADRHIGRPRAQAVRPPRLRLPRPSTEFPQRGANMLRVIADARQFTALSLAALIGVWGLQTHPIRSDDVFLALIALEKPAMF